MIFNKHWQLAGRHAFLAPSDPAWTNYDEDQLDSRFNTKQAAALGDRKHAFAAEAIALGIKMPDTQKTMNQYINDCIGHRMTPEQPLFYSENIFGTADAVSYRDGVLRIFDLKTGKTRTYIRQLETYAAVFCLEYKVSPFEIDIILRIYKSNEIEEKKPEPEEIVWLMEKIKSFDIRIESLKREAAL